MTPWSSSPGTRLGIDVKFIRVSLDASSFKRIVSLVRTKRHKLHVALETRLTLDKTYFKRLRNTIRTD